LVSKQWLAVVMDLIKQLVCVLFVIEFLSLQWNCTR